MGSAGDAEYAVTVSLTAAVARSTALPTAAGAAWPRDPAHELTRLRKPSATPPDIAANDVAAQGSKAAVRQRSSLLFFLIRLQKQYILVYERR